MMVNSMHYESPRYLTASYGRRIWALLSSSSVYSVMKIYDADRQTGIQANRYRSFILTRWILDMMGAYDDES